MYLCFGVDEEGLRNRTMHCIAWVYLLSWAQSCSSDQFLKVTQWMLMLIQVICFSTFVKLAWSMGWQNWHKRRCLCIIFLVVVLKLEVWSGVKSKCNSTFVAISVVLFWFSYRFLFSMCKVNARLHASSLNCLIGLRNCFHHGLSIIVFYLSLFSKQFLANLFAHLKHTYQELMSIAAWYSHYWGWYQLVL